MAAGVALAKANVEGPNGAWAGVALMVRNNVLTLTARGNREPVLRVEDVSTVTRVSRNLWTAETPQGTYTITRVARSCCGNG